MELKEFIKILKSYLTVIIVLAIVGAASGFYSTRYFSSGYHHTQVYFLTDSSAQPASVENIKSENFFTQEKARNFTDTAVAILESPDFKSENIGTGDELIVRKLAPQVIRLTYVSPNADSNNSQLQKVTENFNTKSQSLTGSTQASQLKAVAGFKPPSYSSLNQFVLAVGGAFIGIVFALFVIGVKNYLKI